jgi:predicted DNA-binding protein
MLLPVKKKPSPRSIRIPDELWERIAARAKASALSISAAIRLLIEKGLREVE